MGVAFAGVWTVGCVDGDREGCTETEQCHNSLFISAAFVKRAKSYQSYS